MAVSLEHLNEIAEDLFKVGQATDADVVYAAIAEIERLRAAPVGVNVGVGWQPIETAPRDRRVLIYRPRHGVLGGGTGLAFLSGLDGLWVTIPGRTILDFAPTHWMPLPEPPSSVGVNVGVSASSPEASADTSKA